MVIRSLSMLASAMRGETTFGEQLLRVMGHDVRWVPEHLSR
ncbi:hypothetical protein D3OALGA1CA_4934 [Olavius algarvensis associated proteobacterium Delta 3]|nr:hypothetical protein D3OALGB2SA_2218 [Olavius algarvensis associated proteobacterium Delta 3]CAB5159109.1 hypothetical protein D3OALGA1CA_4934 [Olavius algarvensis associated proteobacterium Delta 3]